MLTVILYHVQVYQQYECIHKLRYYAPKEIALDVKRELSSMLKGGDFR